MHESEIDPIAVAASELKARHALSAGKPRPVAVWTNLTAMSDWLARARGFAALPSPEASKAAEWLLDNDYHVQRAILQIEEDLPVGFYERLPGLEGIEDDGVPRIFAIAHELLRSTRLQLSLGSSVRFVNAYQVGAELTIAELWAFPTMLRLACLEILACGCARLFPELEPPFSLTHLAESCVEFEDTECTARAIANLGVIASVPWKDFFDRTSIVEEILADDPAGIYPRMVFETRDSYRKAVEGLALLSGRAETEVSRCVVDQARTAGTLPPGDHVGHWLVGGGRRDLDRILGVRGSPRAAVGHWLLRQAGMLYAGALTTTSIAALVVPAAYLAVAGSSAWELLLAIALALIPASVLGITAVHWAVTLFVQPRILPKLDFEKAIPAECATAVVVPVILGTAAEVPHLIERLEQHRLASPDPSLRFVILSDHVDAPVEHMPNDKETLDALVEGVDRLNLRYGLAGSAPFHLLHRPRRFNSRENCWMGWERKRGKLEEFNRLVRNRDAGGFSLHVGNPAELYRVRYVVTVDADTVLPPGSVSRLVGTLAHPLNAARFDERTGRLRAGYTILQPRVEVSPENGGQSTFARLYAGNTAIDIYSRAVSDVYQDIFGTGIFVGKGIYDVAAFHRSLEGRIPENALVSHDLFEGIHGRVGLASDIVFYEDFPASYIQYARRWHRWVRGDWQLLPWLAARVPSAGKERLDNPLSRLDRWKILDNLRRSLIPLSLLALAAAGWLILPGEPWIWTILTVAAPGAYLFTDLVTGLARGRRRGAVYGALRQLLDHSGRWLLAIVFLAHEAVLALDAILRTFWRLGVSRRRLLEWTSAAHVAGAMDRGSPRVSAWAHMWQAPALSVALGLAITLVNPAALLPAIPLLLLWLLSPEIACWTSRPVRRAVEEIGVDDRLFLRHLARRTWLYFETFVGPGDNWLPPDNFQEEPRPEIAHRTSPTNIGMMFVSSLTAWDLGYLSTTELSGRLRNGLDTLDLLERHRGHFLNWYDTRLLAPLEPRYVSTVDSGNLAVCMLLLKEGCREAMSAPAVRPAQWDGLVDTVDLLVEAVTRLPLGETDNFRLCVASMSARVEFARQDHAGTWPVLSDIREQLLPAVEAAIADIIARPDPLPAAALHDVQTWLERVQHHLDAMRRDLQTLSPWLPLLGTCPANCQVLAREIDELLGSSTSIADTAANYSKARGHFETAALSMKDAAAVQWIGELDGALERGMRAREKQVADLRNGARRLEAFAFEMDFDPLFDRESRLFHIGYNVSSDHMDSSHYDLLASEARLASLFAIAKGDVAFEHWFHLGRPITRSADGLVLVSWSGSMFEYLMPTLMLRSTPGTLLGESERLAVDTQRRYADEHGIPWGMSESAYAARNVDQHYRYQAFGVPELGLRRGLSRDLVVAPYATALALPIRTRAAISNLRALGGLGLIGSYGFFDAVDFTPERVAAGSDFAPVRAYMAHHQGMILAALGNVLCDSIMVRRFHGDPHIRAVELLIQERVPQELPPEIRSLAAREAPLRSRSEFPAPYPWVPRSAAEFPQVHVLGNGRLASWISEAGGGGSTWHDQALTRFLPDPTRDAQGLWVYVRDEDDDAIWSVGRQPTQVEADESRVVFHPHMAEFHRRDRGIGIHMQVGVVAGDDVEIRRISVVNESDHRRTLRFASYGEVVLAPRRDDDRHPAFSKLFVGSEYLPDVKGLVFTRRPRQQHRPPPVLLHRVVGDDAGVDVTGHEASRWRFLGRKGDMRAPLAMREGLSGTTGWTLDPIMALEIRIELEPHERRQFAFLTLASGSRESVLALADRYATLSSLDWSLADSAAEAAREAQDLRLHPARLPELQALASLLLYRHRALRGSVEAIVGNRLGQARLWGLGISGDNPILAVHAGDAKKSDLLHALIAGHELWRRRGLRVDLVVLRGGASGYVEPIRERLLSLLQDVGVQERLGRNGGIHLILGDQIGDEDRRLVEATASIWLDAARGTLGRQLDIASEERSHPLQFEPTGSRAPVEPTPALARTADLAFDNGLGGFSADGGEYVIHLQPGRQTPAPWSNILANDGFGAIVTESGGGFTWGANSGENRLTPWANDPVADMPGEALYLRDEETAEIWTPTPAPAGNGTACEIRHGAGYTVWRSSSHGLEQELLMFVPVDDPVKIVRLRLRNLGARTRRVTATYYAEWLLGAHSEARPHVVCEYDASCHALVARNPWSLDFAERVAFLTSDRPPHSLTANRQDFLGREGAMDAPAGLLRWDLGGRIEPGADACAAFQVHASIDAGTTAEIVFALGQGEDRDHAKALALRWQQPERVEQALKDLSNYWDRQLGAVRVKTPDAAFDLMVNRWLLQQTLASRLMARAGYYQAGGAIGFRDQLQDVLALLHAEPERARAHILMVAARQFEEGDVLHWWHQPNNRGVRTRCSDDLLWLPYATGCYVEATGDDTILHEEVPFLRAPPLEPKEDDRYTRFDSISEPHSLYEHCRRALDRGVTRGTRQLPLMGSGDWNDGMDRVGRAGRGESVWLAWFAIATIHRFAGLSRRMKLDGVAEHWLGRADQLKQAVEASAWDGAWYLRAFDDDGNALGSADSAECRIDSIAQSWAVMSAESVSDRARIAMESAWRELVREEEGVVRLLWPPFEAPPRNPGYIKAYPPGIRENGGQYSHAAAWLGHAFCRLGDGERALRIFHLLSPISHSATAEDADRYMVEPYVVAADISGVTPHSGRGGWTWYTGAAGWTWRLGIEAILGLRLQEGRLIIDPCLPPDWGWFEAQVRGPSGTLAIRVEDPDRIGSGAVEITLDGQTNPSRSVAFPVDGSTRHVTVRLGPVPIDGGTGR